MSLWYYWKDLNHFNYARNNRSHIVSYSKSFQTGKTKTLEKELNVALDKIVQKVQHNEPFNSGYFYSNVANDYCLIPKSVIQSRIRGPIFINGNLITTTEPIHLYKSNFLEIEDSENQEMFVKTSIPALERKFENVKLEPGNTFFVIREGIFLSRENLADVWFHLVEGIHKNIRVVFGMSIPVKTKLMKEIFQPLDKEKQLNDIITENWRAIL